MDLDQKITAAIERLLGSTAKICVRTYNRDHLPSGREFCAVAWLGGREPRLDFCWVKQELPDPFYYLQSEEAPVEAFAGIDEAVQHIDRLTQRALREEAVDEEIARAAAAQSGRPVAFERLKARMRPGDILIEGAPDDDDDDNGSAILGKEVAAAITHHTDVTMRLEWTGIDYGFENYGTAQVSFLNKHGVKIRARVCRAPGEVTCLVGSTEYADVEEAVAGLAAKIRKIQQAK
jgi:hypothetical protein